MKHLSRVLAAVDFSTPARRAFEQALAIASRHAAELVVVQAVPPEEPFGRHGPERLALKTRLQEIAGAAKVAFAYRVQHGDAAEIILLHAHAIGADAIVVGTHQRRGLERLRAGSVSERVVARAGVPVLVVPAGGRRAAASPFQHVAVAVDFKAASDAAVERALELATDPTQRITLLHAVPGFSSRVPPHLYRYGIAEYQGHAVRDARRRLQLAVPAKRRSPAAIHTRVLRGDTTTELGSAVGTIGADLLVVGVPRRGTVAEALFGTRAARLTRRIDVPLLAVPGAGGKSDRDESVRLSRAA